MSRREAQGPERDAQGLERDAQGLERDAQDPERDAQDPERDAQGSSGGIAQLIGRTNAVAAPPATRRFYAALVAIVLLSALALLPAVSGGFILDDTPLIATNAKLHSLSWENVRYLFTHDMWDVDRSEAQTDERLIYYRPLVMLTYAFDWFVGGGSSLSFHLSNLLLHGLTAFLVGRALLRWSGSKLGALLGTAYFALHPARAESVAWISGRPDVLVTLGMLMCLEGVHALQTPKRVFGAVIFGLGLGVAFGSKETALLLPLLLLIELFSAGNARAIKWRTAWPLIAVLAAGVCYVLTRRLLLPLRPFSVSGLTPFMHLSFVAETLGRITLFLLAPFDLSLSSAYLTERGGKVAPVPGYVAIGSLVALLLCGLLLGLWHKQRRAFWALLVFTSSLLPVLNIVWIGGVGTTAARFTYLPSLLLAWFVIEVCKGRFSTARPRLLLPLAGAGTVTLALLLAIEASKFESATRFWVTELRSRPDVPTNIEQAVKRDWAAGEFDRGLARSLCQYRMATERFGFSGEGGRIIMTTLERWASLLPDVKQDELRAIADFVRSSREPGTTLTLSSEPHIEVPANSKVRRELLRLSARGRAFEAALRVRLGEPEAALELVRAARAECPRCDDLLDRQAYVAYQAFDADLAEQWLGPRLDEYWGAMTKRAALARLRGLNQKLAQSDGPVRAELEVERLLELKLYGEALKRLEAARHAAPHDIALTRITMTVAELAGARQLSAELARQLQVAAPISPPRLAPDEIRRFLAQLHDGCAFPEELNPEAYEPKRTSSLNASEPND